MATTYPLGRIARPIVSFFASINLPTSAVHSHVRRGGQP
jgi:hypothetical protein